MSAAGIDSFSTARGPGGAVRAVASLQRLVAELSERVDDLATELAELAASPRPRQTALLTVDEAAAELGVSRSRIFGLIKTGALRSIKLGASRRIPRDAVDELVANLANCQYAA